MKVRLCLVAIAIVSLSGCNALNPFCSSARPDPLIGSLSPSTISFSQVQQGATLTVRGSQFVAASEVVINGKPLSTAVVNSSNLKVTLTTGIIAGPGTVKVSVLTPTGSSADLGCTSGGKSSVLTLNVN